MQAVRSGAAWLTVALAVAVLVGVAVQVYLIGAYLFGAGGDALDAHRAAGFVVHSIEVLVLVAALVAWQSRAQVLLALVLAVLGTVQLALAEAERWAGGLHAFGALVVLVVAAVIVQRGVRGRRAVAASA